MAAIYAASLATGTDVTDVAVAARSAPLGPEPSPARQLLLLGLATRLTDGYAAATPMLTRGSAPTGTPSLDWTGCAWPTTSQRWSCGTTRPGSSSPLVQAELARATGTLLSLPYALDYLAGFHIQAGELSLAARLVTEAEGLDLRIRAETLPYIPLRLAAWRGQASAAVNLVGVMFSGARARGEGCAISAAHHAAAILYNGLGRYELALDSAQQASDLDDIATSSWALPELVEAASRSGRAKVARDAADRLSERALASGTKWAKGTAACSRALVEEGDSAEELYRQAIEALDETRMKAHLARARLKYGEWLRRQDRRVDARPQLREAHEMFTAMGANGFADRARRELLATGEKVRKRRRRRR